MNSNLWGLGAATVLFSLVGLLVKLIHLPPESIGFGRAFYAFIALGVFFLIRKRDSRLIPRRPIDLIPLSLLGIFIGGNWFFYFLAIKTSTIAVAVVSLFTYPLMTALLEPLIIKKPYNLIDCIGGLVVIIGVFLVVPRFELTDRTTLGVLFGLLSAASLTLANLLNKKLVAGYAPPVLMVYQFFVVMLLFAPGVSALARPLPLLEYGFLFILGAILTTLSQFFFINSLKKLSAGTSSILISLQPFCTILLAYIFLKEAPTTRTLIGGLVICVAVGCAGVMRAGLTRESPPCKNHLAGNTSPDNQDPRESA